MSSSCQAFASLWCTTEARQRVKACPRKCLATFGMCRRVGVWLAWISSKLGKVGPVASCGPPMADCCTGQRPAGRVSTMADGHAKPTNRAPLAPLGLQPTCGEVPLQGPGNVGIHMVLHGTHGLPPRRSRGIRAWARGHRAVDPPSP